MYQISAIPPASDELYTAISHVLEKAAHGFNFAEKRILSACLTQIANVSSITHEPIGQFIIRLSALDYSAQYDVPAKLAYHELKNTTEKLFDRQILVRTETPSGVREHKFRWLASVEHHHGEEWVELGLTREVMPYIGFLRNHYKEYQLKITSSLRSTYSWRLLELFKSWKTTKELSISLDEFRHAMEIPESYVYADIRVKCIEPALRELQEKNDLIATWLPVKKGRSVDQLKFRWIEKEMLTEKEKKEYRLATREERRGHRKSKVSTRK